MQVVLVGNPNVGKSALINALTGSKMPVANYPGTSIKSASVAGPDYQVFDTPGIYSLCSGGGASQTVRNLVHAAGAVIIVNVVDAANLERNLMLTLELLDLPIPMILAVNQVDQAKNLGLTVDSTILSDELHCPVVLLSATDRSGLDELRSAIERMRANPVNRDANKTDAVGEGAPHCSQCGLGCGSCHNEDNIARFNRARQIVYKAVKDEGSQTGRVAEQIQDWLDRPLLGTVILLLLAYAGFYVMIQTIHFMEGPIQALLDPLGALLGNWLSHLLPQGIINRVVSHAVPEGLIVPFTIIMPAMVIISFLMAVLEDTGLLPRYSVALERATSFMGLSGQAVIPLTMGFGCRTPAIMATSLLPNHQERFIAAVLLSIVIPCAASLGVIAAVVSKFHASLAVVAITMLTVLFLLGYILSRIMPKEARSVYELAPLRMPAWPSIWHKVIRQCSGFFTEVLPFLLLMNIVLRGLIESGFFALFGSLEGLARAVFGIPAEALVAVLITVFQRYLAPLVLLNLPLTPREATIAISMIALSLPCLPVMTMVVKEMGWKRLMTILGMGAATSMVVGIALNLILPR